MAVSKSVGLAQALRISRPFWWVNTSAGFVAGYAVIGGRHDLTLWLGAAYFAVAYNLLMYGVNDVYDYETDIRNPRKDQATILQRSQHKSLWVWMLTANLPFIVYLYAVGSTAANLWFSCMLFMVFAYSVAGLRFKEKPFLDSLTSSFHYTSPLLYGALVGGASNVFLPVFIAYFLWAMGNHAFGAVQDITPDREGKVQSVATILGAQATLIWVMVYYAASLVISIVSYGWLGLYALLAITPSTFLVLQTWPERHNDAHKIFRRNWKLFQRVNYVTGFLATTILLLYILL